jgi:hypothetical protein
MGYGGNGSGGVFQVDNTEIKNQIANVSAQLADTENKVAQVDFVEMIRESNNSSSKLRTKILADRKIEIAVPFNDGLYAKYTMAKDANDDYMTLQGAQIGTINLQTELKNYSASTGTIVSAAPNNYASVVGSTVSLTFTGKSISMRHIADTRGGIWEVQIDGTVVGTISTHIDAMTALGLVSEGGVYTRLLADGLTNAPHTLVATFKGDDQSHAPVGGSSRGWIRFEASTSNRHSFSITKHEYAFTSQFSTMVADSNKEYAFSHMVKNGQGAYGTAEWLPDHNGRGSAFATSQKIVIDGKEVTDWTVQNDYYVCDSVTVIQDMLGYHATEDLVNPSARILTTHFFTSKGVHIMGKLEALRDIKIVSGYTFMFPIDLTFANRLITGYRNKYQTGLFGTASSTVLNEKFNCHSFAFVNNSDASKRNIVVAMTMHNVQDTLRYGKAGRDEVRGTWIEHRSAAMDKLYPQIFKDYEMKAGEIYRFSGTFHVGKIPLINDFF